MRIGGVFNGTAADVYLCIGFVPDYVTIWNLEGSGIVSIIWNKGALRASEVVEGIEYSVADQQASALTKGNGLQAYYGGKVLASGDVGTTTFGEGVYLKPDIFDYRRVNNTEARIVGDATEVDIDTWTLTDLSGNKGKFNGAVAGTYIGVGSPINIDGRTYSIVGFTADGGDDDDVVLNLPVQDGTIYAINGMYDYKPMVAGERTSDGFFISNTDVNTNDEMVAFEAGKYNN